MNIFKGITLLFCLAALTAQAQTSTARSTTEEATVTAVESTSARKPSRKSAKSHSASDNLSVTPGTLATLCCGSLNPHSMAGQNCAYMHTGQGCGGYILACPGGTSETVTEAGDGYCKEN